MALEICPKCKENSFTWFINGKNHLTSWSCFNCDYEAQQTDDKVHVCENCRETLKIQLKDRDKQYWWCSGCNVSTTE